MKKVSVRPATDGIDMRSNWMVHVGGKMKSTHTKKSAAVRQAREFASEGDTLEIRRTDGTIQETVTVRNASGSEQQDNPLIPGEALFETGVSDFFK